MLPKKRTENFNDFVRLIFYKVKNARLFSIYVYSEKNLVLLNDDAENVVDSFKAIKPLA